MKKTGIIILMIGLNFISAQKVAYVQEAKILKTINGYEAKAKEIDSLRAVYTNQIQGKSKESIDKLNTILLPYKFGQNETESSIKGKLKPADLKKVEQIQKDISDTEVLAKKHQEKIENMFKSDIEPSLKKINKTIEDYSKKNKIDMIYKLENIGSALAYVNNRLEVTDEIIKLLK